MGAFCRSPIRRHLNRNWQTAYLALARSVRVNSSLIQAGMAYRWKLPISATAQFRLGAIIILSKPMPLCASIAQRHTANAWTFRQVRPCALSPGKPSGLAWLRLRVGRSLMVATTWPRGKFQPQTKRLRSNALKPEDSPMPHKMKRAHYAEMFGPTTGDKVRLGDTSLVLEVEKDHTVYGDECKFGGGKVIREGMGQAAGVGDAEALDVVITNALVVDYTGIYKADIGIKKGLIAGIGKAGNPDVMAGVGKEMIVGVTTEVIAGEGLIVTAGG